MLRFVTQHRVLLLILLLLLIGLHLLSSGMKHKSELGLVGKVLLTIYNPIYKVINWPFAEASALLSKYLYLLDVKETNRNLQTQNTTLQKQLVEIEELRAENQRLTELLNLKDNHWHLVANARVIGRSPHQEFRSLLIDKGSSSGVQKGMAAIAPQGLVGFIADVTPNAAKAVIITDPSSRVDGIIQRTRKRTMVFGRGEDVCSLEYLEQGVDIADGDRIITSGLDGIFPKSVQIGLVTGVRRGNFGVLQQTRLQPSVDLNAVEEVAVVTGGLDLTGLGP